MKWNNYLGICTGILANININNILNKANKEMFLSLYVNSNVSNLEILVFSFNFLIKVFTGVNLYNLEESLRMFGII